MRRDRTLEEGRKNITILYYVCIVYKTIKRPGMGISESGLDVFQDV